MSSSMFGPIRMTRHLDGDPHRDGHVLLSIDGVRFTVPVKDGCIVDAIHDGHGDIPRRILVAYRAAAIAHVQAMLDGEVDDETVGDLEES